MATAVVTGYGAENERPHPASSSNADYASDGGSAAERNGKVSFQLASGSFEESVSQLSCWVTLFGVVVGCARLSLLQPHQASHLSRARARSCVG
jgi:hypothetical protein